jgi:methyl-accepting chemotaxis protein
LTERSTRTIGELVEQRLAAQRRLLLLQLSLAGGALLLAGYLIHCFNLVTNGGLREISRHIDALAAGDLSTSPRPWGRDEVAHVLKGIEAMQLSLRSLIGQVRQYADEIVTSSAEVSHGADDLSQRTEATASRLQQASSTMDTIARTAGQTAQSIGETASLGQRTAGVAAQNKQVFDDVVSTMVGIDTASRRVADILGVIDGIAFQTNILALNAAVEAARAGEQGRGFAVVAAEVRVLAQRSAGAAREIKTLIADSTAQTARGTQLVGAANHTMNELLANLTRVCDTLVDVSRDSEQQTRGVNEVSHSVAELDQDTQRNAALVEQTSAAAISMTSKAVSLADAAARFVLPDGAATATVR